MRKEKVVSPRLIIFILGALCTISPFSIDMYLPAFQQIADQFHVTAANVSMTVSSYFIGLAAGQLLYGPFLDRYGRKPPLLVGLFVYLIATVMCLLSVNFNMLVGARIFQALGGCGAQVATTAMVRDFFSPKDGAKVFARLMLILSVSPLFAPTIGSLLIVQWGWHSVFIVLAGIVVVIAALVIFVLPEGHGGDVTQPLHVVPISKTFFAIARHRQFFAYSVAGGLSFSGLFAYVAGAPAIFLSRFHVGERQFGLIFAFLSVGMIGGGQVNNWLTKKHSGQMIFRASIYMQLVIAGLFFALVSMDQCGLASHLVILFTYLLCVGLTYPNAAAIALEPFEKNAGSASALLGMLQMSIGAIVSAIFAAVPLPVSISVSLLFLITSVLGAVVLRFGSFYIFYRES